ncbi:MAG: hypothetical protein L3J75_14450 [Methylococcaceae bacterium]|nr:hypothetical protein [Methylococcaceae bacterium]
MNEPTEIDIDYEHIDDLPLSDHIEWNHFQIEKVCTDELNDSQSDWLAA